MLREHGMNVVKSGDNYVEFTVCVFFFFLSF